MLRRTAGLWGPVAFLAAATVAARREPGYSHLRHHVSGLAARGHRSAAVMVPGFIALAAAHAVIPAPTPSLRRMARIAGATTLAAGVIQVSDPRCPQPGDPEATISDLGHGLASIATFGLWTAMPLVAATSDDHPDHARLARVIAPPMIAAFVTAGVTTLRESPMKGLAQRTFLGTVFLFLGATGLAAGSSTSPGQAG